ncbi:MAG TPA: hypothetical protein VMX79_12745 [bacterium]|nr:hypothetical protein [bacterium]
MNIKKTAWVTFILLIGFYLGLFWFNRYVPTQDGPCHLENAIHLRDLCLSGGTGVEQYYRLNRLTYSNLLYHTIVGAFGTVIPPLAAERLFFSIYVIGFAAAAYALARSTGAQTAVPAIAALPYALAFPFHMGFFNYCAGLVIAFAAWAYFLWRRDGLRARDFIILNAAGVLAYLTHAATAVILLAGLFVLNAWLAVGERVRERKGVKKRLAVFAALLPAFVLPAYFIAAWPPSGPRWLPWRDVATSFITGSSFRFYSAEQLYLGLASLGVVLAAVAFRVIARTPKAKSWLAPRNGLLVLALGTLALYFLAPDAASGFGVLSGRLLIIPWVLLLVWAGDDFIRTGRWVVFLAATAFALAFGVDTLSRYRKFNRELRDFCSGIEYVEDGSKVAYLYFSGWQYRIAVFAGASSYYAIGRDVLNFGNSEADQYTFPVNFDYDGFRPLPWDLWPCEKYRVRKFAPAVDYVITWELPDKNPVAKKLWRFYKGVHAQGRLMVFQVKDKYKKPRATKPKMRPSVTRPIHKPVR